MTGDKRCEVGPHTGGEIFRQALQPDLAVARERGQEEPAPGGGHAVPRGRRIELVFGHLPAGRGRNGYEQSASLTAGPTQP